VIGRVKGLLLVFQDESTLAGRGPYPLEELCGADSRGAGSLDEESTIVEEREGELRQPTVCGERLLPMRARACEGGRVHDYGVETLALGPERFHDGEGVPLSHQMAARRHTLEVSIQLEVASCLDESWTGLVHTHDFPRTTPCCVEGECAGVAKEVENSCSGGAAGQLATVVPLVEIESGLVSQMWVCLEEEPTLQEGDSLLRQGPEKCNRSRRADSSLASASCTVPVTSRGLPGPTGLEKEDPLGREQVLDRPDQASEMRDPTPGVELEDERAIVKICNETWEAIVLTVDNAVSGGF
jgi:hypothetical protein